MGVIPQNSSQSSPLQPIAAHSYIKNLVRGVSSSKVLTLQPNAAHSYMAILIRGYFFIADYSYMVVLVRGVGNFQNPPIADHWIPNLHGSLSQEGECNFSEVLLMQPIAAHPYMKILGRGANSSKFLPLQPITAHSYIVILVGGWVIPQNSPIADHWSPNLLGSLSQGRGCNSSEVPLMQPNASHPYVAILVRGGNHSKALPLQLTLTWQF